MKPPQKPKLKFNQSLVQSASAGNKKQLTSIVLYDRLKALHEELRQINTDNPVPDLSQFRTELIHKSLLTHKDKAVRALTACCLAHVLRVFAPDAPYTQAELRDVFLFIFKQLVGLWKVDNGKSQMEVDCFAEYASLLENLAQVKSVVLVVDLPKADSLITDIFRHFISGIRPDTPKKLQSHMSDILSQILDEAETLPAEIIPMLLSQVEDGAPSCSAEFVFSVFLSQQERLQRCLSSHFSEIMIAGTSPEIEEDEMNAIELAHQQICNLHLKVPLVLLNVIAHLEMELLLDNTEIRVLVTRTLGKMFAHPQSLVKESPAIWKAWILKELDKSFEVRSEFASCLLQILTSHPELAEEASQKLINKLMDNDERVRVSACKIFTTIDFELALYFLPKLVLQQLALRCVDKKRAVRILAMQSLGRLYNLAFGQIEGRDNSTMDQFAWIPTAFISPLTNPVLDVRVDAEQCIHKYILPLPKDSSDSVLKQWVDRLLIVMTSFASQKMETSILVLSNMKFCRDTLFRFIETCKNFNGGTADKSGGLDMTVVKKDLEDIIHALSISTLDSSTVAAELHAFANANVKMAYQTLERILKPNCDMSSLLKNRQEFFNRISAMKGCSTETFEFFVNRSSFPIINAATTEVLINKLDTDPDENLVADILSPQRKTVIGWIAKYRPTMLEKHSSQLFKILNKMNEPTSQTSMEAGALALECVASLSRTKKLDELDESTNMDILLKFATSGDMKQSKFACRTIAHSPNSEPACETALQTVIADLQRPDILQIAPRVTALAELAKSAPVPFEKHSETVFKIILKNLLLQKSEDTATTNNDWLPESHLNDISQAQLRCLSVMTNRCLSIPLDGQDLHKTMSPISSLLSRLILQDGSFDPKSPYSNPLRARMRLQAGLCLIKLAKQSGFDKPLFDGHQERYESIAFLLQDEMYEVRREILSKIMQTATLMTNSCAKWQAALALVAQDPEEEARILVTRFWATRQSAWDPKCRLTFLEMPFIRLLHLLSHHPDFGKSPEDIKDTSSYIKFYLDRILNKQNSTFLFHIAQKLKTVRDKDPRFPSSENLYILSELACHLISVITHKNSWPLTTHQGKISMPGDIFAPLSSSDVAKEIANRRYLDPACLPHGSTSIMSPPKKIVKPKKSPKPVKTTAAKRKRESLSDHDVGSDGDHSKENRTLDSDTEKKESQRPKRVAAENANRLLKGIE